MFQRVLLCLSSIFLSFSTALSTTSTIYIIRHGEKKWALGCLSAAGQKRANLLPSIFDGSKFSTPERIFANYYDDKIDCERCIQTVTPIAKKLNLSVNSTYGYNVWLGGNELAAQAFRRVISVQKVPTTILVAWEHVNIKPLTEALGVDGSTIPTWGSSDFDTVFVLDVNTTGHVIGFRVAAENITGTTLLL
jgi:hypothetical protein